MSEIVAADGESGAELVAPRILLGAVVVGFAATLGITVLVFR